ncbi:MAG: recombinase family protein [Oscillospiraceae bacterium]|nr:recombinase family protein [Oscillospiraceae bacterium]
MYANPPKSVEGQLRECNEYAERHNMTIVNTYVEEEFSAIDKSALIVPIWML